MGKIEVAFIPLSQAADSNGVSRFAVADWMRRRNLYRPPYRRVEGKQHMIRLDIVERYAATRAASRPKGWPTLKGLCAELEINRGGRLALRTMKPLRTKLYRKVAYMHPEDAEFFKREILALKPPKAYVPVGEAAASLNRTRQALCSWCKYRGIILKTYSDGNNLRLFIHERDLERYTLFLKGRGHD